VFLLHYKENVSYLCCYISAVYVAKLGFERHH